MIDKIHPYNKTWIGIIAGLIVPFVGYALFLTLFDWLETLSYASSEGLPVRFRPRTLTMLAISLNIFLVLYGQKRRWMDSVSGVTIATMMAAVFWVIYYRKDFFGV